MAAHLRTQIRDAVAAALTGLPTTGARVYPSRVYPVQTADLPCLLVYARRDDVQLETIHAPKYLQRTVELEVVALAKAASDLDDVLDQMCKEVEAALAMPVAALAGIAQDINPVSTEFELVGAAEKPTGSASMIFTVGYFNLENAPDVAH